MVLKRLADSAGGSLLRRGVPERFHLKDWYDLEIAQEQQALAQSAIEAGNSVTICGPAGTGKTHLAVCLIRHWLMNAAQKLIGEELNAAWPNPWDEYTADGFILERQHDFLPQFVSVPDFFFDLKATFGTDKSEKQTIDRYTTSRALLVFDDLGAEKVSDWSRQILFTLIDRRYRNCQAMVVTTNLTLQDLARHYDDRIPSRLVEMGAIVNLKGRDYRLKRSE